jgi:cell division septation protein DedD
MEHHYSLTGRMLAIFVGGLIVLGILLFAFGLLAGREWGASEAVERLSAAKHSPASAVAPAAQAAAPAAVPTSSLPAAAVGTGAAAGAIRPAAALPPLSAAPALPGPPKAPTVPRLPSLPAAPTPPSMPAAPKLPSMSAAPELPLPTRSSQANPARDVAAAGLSHEAGMAPAAMQASRANSENTSSENGAGAQSASARETDKAVQGFVVYVGAFESGAKAENIAQKLRSRNLAAQTSPVERPGRKPLVTVWVGPFDDHAGAEAVIPDIHAAGLKDTMIREVP